MKRLPNFVARAVPLIKLASEYTASQLVIRVMAAISSLLLIRMLPVSEYGFYTLVLSAFGFICTFSDLGLTETLSFFRLRSIRKNRPWIQYFDAVVRFRKYIFIFGFLAASCYIYSAGRSAEVDLIGILFGIFLTGFGAWFAIQSSVNVFVLKLEQRFRPAYAVDICNESMKLVGVFIIFVFGFTTAIAGFIGVALGAFVAALLSMKLLDQTPWAVVSSSNRQKNKARKILVAQVLPILPGTIHFALQGPLIAGLAAIYGTIENVAAVGALGRLGVLIGIIGGFTTSVFVPRIVSIKNERLFFRRYLLWWLIIISFGILVLALMINFPEVLLLLGGSYRQFHNELLLAASSSVAMTWLAFAWSVNRARGWVKLQPYRVLVIVLGQIPMFYILDFSLAKGALMFALGTILIDVVFQTAINFMGFAGLRGGNMQANK